MVYVGQTAEALTAACARASTACTPRSLTSRPRRSTAAACAPTPGPRTGPRRPVRAPRALARRPGSSACECLSGEEPGAAGCMPHTLRGAPAGQEAGARGRAAAPAQASRGRARTCRSRSSRPAAPRRAWAARAGPARPRPSPTRGRPRWWRRPRPRCWRPAACRPARPTWASSRPTPARRACMASRTLQAAVLILGNLRVAQKQGGDAAGDLRTAALLPAGAQLGRGRPWKRARSSCRSTAGVPEVMRACACSASRHAGPRGERGRAARRCSSWRPRWSARCGRASCSAPTAPARWR